MNHLFPRSTLVSHLLVPGSPDPPISFSGPELSSCQAVCEPRRLSPDSATSDPALADRSQKVLVLSGDSCFCSLIRSYLESSGLNVFTCSSPDRARTTFLNRCEINFTLIDVQSLGVTAVFFARHLYEIKPQVPILIIEGARPDESVLRSFLIDTWTTARKPVELPHLLATIYRLLARAAPLVSCDTSARNLCRHPQLRDLTINTIDSRISGSSMPVRSSATSRIADRVASENCLCLAHASVPRACSRAAVPIQTGIIPFRATWCAPIPGITSHPVA